MAAAPTQETTASPLDSHASPVSDRPAGAGKTRHGRATAALIVSILGIVFAIFFALVGLILSIIGTVLAATAQVGHPAPRDGRRRSGEGRADLRHRRHRAQRRLDDRRRDHDVVVTGAAWPS